MAHTYSTATADPLHPVGLETSETGPRTRLPWRWSRLARLDRWAVTLLVAIPMLIEVPPAFFGRLLLNGDNLTQNYPTRVLAGELLRHGRLPLWDPYIWSGTPLLAGWNAGALYPGTWLFAIMPAEAAWTANVVSVSVICGIGLQVFLRRLGCSPLASLLGALTFTYTGFMTGQAEHYGLVAGMSFTPWMLLAVHELAASPEPREARRWIALLGSCAGLVVLAGDPRSVSSAGIVVAIYFVASCWRVWRARRRAAVVILGVLAAGLLAAGLSAVQWLPGLSFLHESERAADTLTSFAAGSLTWHDLSLLFVPLLVGGNGNFRLPHFAGSYNLPELSYAVGIMPLVAAFALVRRALHGQEGESPLGVWYVLIVVGLVLSAGANTPLGHVLESLPLYGGQRLQNRNAVLVDLALAVLLAMFVDVLAARAGARGSARDRAPATGPALARYERAAGLVPVGIVVLLVLAAYVFGHWVQSSLGVPAYLPTLADELTPYFVATLVISAGAGYLLIAAPRLGPRRSRLLVTVVVAADVLLSLVDAPAVPVAPGALTLTSALSRENPAAVALANLLGAQGRYAIFNPLQSRPSRYANTLYELGPFDLGILHGLESVQGYGSAVAGSYEDATGGHEVENLQPAALAHSNLGTLNLKELVTLPQYLVSELPGKGPIPVATGVPVPPGTEAAAEALNAIAPQQPQPSLPPTLLSPGRSSAWILPGPVELDSVTIVLVPYDAELPATISVGVLDAGDQVVDERQVPVVDSRVQVDLHGRVAYGIDVGAPGDTSATVGAVAVTTVVPLVLGLGPPAHRFVLNQILQGVLEPPRWRYQTEIGGLPVFTNTLTRGAAWLEPAGSTTPLAQLLSLARAASPAVEPWQDPVTVVSTRHPALLVRSAAYGNGWVARLTPIGHGPSVRVPVRRLGVVQAISVPSGRFTVTWLYTASSAKFGFLASVVSTLVLVLLVFTPRRRRKPKSHGRLPRSPEPVTGSDVVGD